MKMQDAQKIAMRVLDLPSAEGVKDYLHKFEAF
jgi:hypothetical protein